MYKILKILRGDFIKQVVAQLLLYTFSDLKYWYQVNASITSRKQFQLSKNSYKYLILKPFFGFYEHDVTPLFLLWCKGKSQSSYHQYHNQLQG